MGASEKTTTSPTTKQNSADLSMPLIGHTPNTAETFRKKSGKNSGKTAETLSEAFPGIPIESAAGIPQAL